MSSQYGELRPTSGLDLLASLGHPCKFQRVSRLGSVTARHSSNGRQSNVAALNRGRHLYSAGRPSRWASAHILVTFLFASSVSCKDNTTNMSDIRNIRMLFGNPKKRQMAKDRSVLVCHLLLLYHFCESRQIILKWCCLMKDFYGNMYLIHTYLFS